MDLYLASFKQHFHLTFKKNITSDILAFSKTKIMYRLGSYFAFCVWLSFVNFGWRKFFNLEKHKKCKNKLESIINLIFYLLKIYWKMTYSIKQAKYIHLSSLTGSRISQRSRKKNNNNFDQKYLISIHLPISLPSSFF